MPTEVVQTGGDDVITALTTISDKIWQTREWQTPLDPILGHHSSQERQPAVVSELPKDQRHQPSKQSHAEDHTEQTEATSREDHR